MIAEVVVMDEITRVECKGKKEMRAKVWIKDTNLSEQNEKQEFMKEDKKEKP